MKKHLPPVLSKEVWKEMEGFFHRHPIPCLPPGSSADGMEPVEIETTKRGVVIRMDAWFLTGGNPELNPQLKMELCLARPRFSALQSVTVEKVRTSTVEDSYLDGNSLHVTLI